MNAPVAILLTTPCPDCELEHGAESTCPASRGAVTRAQRPILLDTPAPLDPFLGTRVGNFVLQRRLGQGGMGAVYLGENPTIGSKVAVKFLHPSLARDPGVVRRFYDEARAANLVAHENVVRVLDLGHDPERGFHLIMEYVPGRTLAEALRAGPLPLAFGEQVLAQICAALGEAHKRGVVHRDLKPENILLLERGAAPQVKITDFGIAKLRAETAAGATALGEMLGTPAYMSPEQCRGTPADARTDIYALGVMAYELCTGRPPFSGNIAALLTAHLTEAPRPPRELRPDLPARWNQAILRALQKDPDQRFADVASFIAALQCPEPTTEKPAAVLEVTLAPGLPPVPLRALELSRGGALLCFAGRPPPIFSMVRVALRGAGRSFDLEAEVVRHVSAEEARTWKSEPGFAIQFRGAPPGLTQTIQALGQVAQAPSGLPARQRELLAQHAARLAAGHYELLGLQKDASFAEIAERGSRMVAELREIEAHALAPEELAQLRAALARVAWAVSTLGAPLPRLRYDGSIGNFLGAARALAGLSATVAEREHAAFRAARPDLDACLGMRLSRVKLARARGNRVAALDELELALQLDPLDSVLHRMRAELA